MRIKTNNCLSFSLLILSFFAVSFLYITCFWQSIHPSHILSFPFDNSCFYLIGHGMRLGKMPYLDYIDNKGPVTYLLYALSAYFGHFPWGVFFIGVVCVFTSLLGIYVLCRRLGIRKFYWLQILFLFSYAFINTEGGMTEDLSIPFWVWTIVVFADFYRASQEGDFHFRYGIQLAVLFWFCALTRFNNAVFVASVAFCIGFYLLVNKELKKAATLVSAFVAGSVVSVLPFILWLWKHNALTECINQVLLNNFKYSDATDALSKREIFFSISHFSIVFYSVLIGCILCIVLFGNPFKKENRFLCLSALFVTGVSAMACLVFTLKLTHYNLCLLPALLFCMTIAFTKEKTKSKRTNQVIACLMAALMVADFFGINGFSKLKTAFWYAEDMAVCILRHDKLQEEEWITKVKQMTDVIPDDEKNSVFLIDTTAKWLIVTDIEPCKRMFVCPRLFTSISENYAQEFDQYFQQNPPKWLLVQDPLDQVVVPKTSTDLTALYHLKSETIISKDVTLYLYHFKENANA